MQLKLEVVRDINVLVASGPIEPANFAVLKAGIKKLFKDGKNKIILELPDSSQLSTDILRELAVMNLLASELAGQIVLSGIAPLTRAKIESFSKPPVVRCFADRSGAAEFFYPKPSEVTKPNPVPAGKKFELPPEAASPPTSATTPESAQRSKSDVRAKELGDLGELRKRLNDLETENRELKTQLTSLVATRRDPPDLDSWKEKVSRLEKELETAIAAAQNAPGAKK
jgi:hypothetical protein